MKGGLERGTDFRLSLQPDHPVVSDMQGHGWQESVGKAMAFNQTDC